MAPESHADYVTLSDSFTSPIPTSPQRRSRPAAATGAPNVVCLDSDTESDGSCAEVCNKKILSVDQPSSVSIVGANIELKEHVETMNLVHGLDSPQILPSFEKGLFTRSGCFDFHIDDSPQQQASERGSFSTKEASTSPIVEVNSSFSLRFQSVQQGKDSLECSDADDEKRATKQCHSLFSDDQPDDSLPVWNDCLKGIIDKIEACKSSNINVERDYRLSDDSEFSDSNKDFEWKRKPHVIEEDDADPNDAVDNAGRKRQKKTTESRTTKVSETLIEKQRKQDTRLKDKEEKESKKRRTKEEREMLKREMQEERRKQQEERRKKNEEAKRRKEELKAEAVQRRKIEKEKEKWEKGKFALQNITAFVDTRILEGGLVGGHLLTRFAEKGFKYHIVQNPIKKTVIWKMQYPSDEPVHSAQVDCQSQDSQDLKTSTKSGPQLSLKSRPVSYVLVVLEAEEFIDMINKDMLDKHVTSLKNSYPGFTLCYLINKLMRYLQKREQQQYKKSESNWVRPPVEQVLAKFITSYDGVHSRVCLDEAEVAEHIVGLTRSLAECPFRRKLSTLTLRANGDHVVKNDPNNDVIRKNLWLKALVALPKVSGACAIAIAKKYPSISSLFEAYLDPSKTVHEKECLLQDLMKEGLLGGDSSRRVGPVCSRRIYRILMAQRGDLHTDDVEEGADLFTD